MKMSCRKTIFSNLLWGLYAIVIGGGLFCMVALLGDRAGSPLAYAVFIAAGILGLAGLVNVLAVKYLQGMIDRTPETFFSLWNTFLGFVFWICLFFGAGSRLYMTSRPADPSGYFQKAFVSLANGRTQTVGRGAEYAYSLFLRTVCMVFGNSLEVCADIQVLLQLAAIAFFYLAVKKLAGKFPATLFFAFAMCSVSVIRDSVCLSPRPLYLALYGLALWTISWFYGWEKKPAWSAVVFGGAVGWMTYLDVTGIALLVPVLYALFLGAYTRPEPEFEIADGPGMKIEQTTEAEERRVLALWSIWGVVTAFFCSIFAESFSGEESFLQVLTAWGELYLPKESRLQIAAYLYGNDVAVLIVLSVSAIGIFSYFVRKGTEEVSLWAYMACLLLALDAFGMYRAETNGNFVVAVCVTALAGIGMVNLPAAAGERERVSDMERFIEDISNGNMGGDAGAPQKPIEYIKNPLPLPKKHERRVLDFDYDIAEDDDFDV